MCLSSGRAIVWGPIHTNYELGRQFAFDFALFMLSKGVGPYNLFANAPFDPLKDASHTLRREPQSGQRRDFFGAHALPKVEPEYRTVALAVGAGQDPLQQIVDLTLNDGETNFFLTAMRILACFRIHIPTGNMRLVASR